MKARVRIFKNAKAIAEAAASTFVATVEAASKERRSAFVALSGGSTPKILYELLAQGEWRDRVDWGAVEIFFGDERCVPPNDAESNYGLAKAALFDRVGIPAERVHRMEAEDPDGDAAAARYAGLLRAKLPRAPNGSPVFDLIWLGMGADGHTASLFPGSPALENESALVVATVEPRLGARRMTMTLSVLSAARRVQFLVTGTEKAERVAEALKQSELPGRRGVVPELPAARVRPAGMLEWLLDEAAASRIG